MTIPNALIGIAGVHYVVSELSFRGLIALPTIKNTDAYDIIAATVEGDKHANIQVKTSSKRTTYWPMPSIEKIRSGRQDFYVLVRRLEEKKQFECFMLTGREAKNAVEESIAWQKDNIQKGTRKSVFHAIDESANSPRLIRWKKAWEEWVPK